MELQVVQDRVGENCWELLEQWHKKQFVGRWAGKRRREMYMTEILEVLVKRDW